MADTPQDRLIGSPGAGGPRKQRALSDPTAPASQADGASISHHKHGYHAAFVRQRAYVAPMVPIIRELGPGLQNPMIASLAGAPSTDHQTHSIQASGGHHVGADHQHSLQHSLQHSMQSEQYGQEPHNQQWQHSLQSEPLAVPFDRPHVIYDPTSYDDLGSELASIDGTDFLVEGANRGTMLDMALKGELRSQMISIFMLCSISLGVGVFVLPNILLTTGVATGIVMIIVFAFFAGYAQYISIDCAMYYKSHSYESMASSSLGKLGEFLLAFFMAISLFTGNCSHIATVGQLLHDIIDWFYTDQYTEYKFHWKKTAILYAVMLCLTLPWLFQRNLSGLSSVGTISVMVVLITSISLVVNSLVEIDRGSWASHNSGHMPVYGFDNLSKQHFWTTDFWSTAPTFGFVFTGLLELFPVFNELQGRNPRKAKQSILISTVICAVIYICVSSIVVMRYGTKTDDNSLYNVPPNNYWITFLCFALVIVITLLYPVINYPMVNAIEKMLEFMPQCRIPELDNIMNDDNISVLLPPALKKSGRHWFMQWVLYRRRHIISIIGVLAVIGVDIGVKNLADLFGLCGSLGLSFVCYIFPCLIHLKTFRKTLSIWKILVSLFILIFFTFLMVYSTIVIIINIIHGK